MTEHHLKGKPKTEEAKAKMRAAKLGKKLPAKTRQKMSMSRTGHTHSEETKAKISEAKIACAALREKLTGTKYNIDDSHILTSDSRQYQKPYWIDDKCWTEFKTNCELWHLIDLSCTTRNLWPKEKEWIHAIFKNIEIIDNF